MTHRGAFTNEETNRFFGVFRADEGVDRPPAGVQEAMLEFSDQHGRIHLWSRRKCSMLLPADVFTEASHCVVWLGPHRPKPEEFRAAAASLATAAGKIESS